MANNCNKTFRDHINDGQAQVLGIVSIVPMGDWNATSTYQKLNYVRHNGATYLAKVANNNVEPGVAPNWQDVWMLCNYDGGLVVPDGTYPNLTAGKVVHALMWGSKSYDGSSPQTITAEDLGIASTYVPQGSIPFSELPETLSKDNLGYMWDISDNFTTDSRFIEGAGKQYSAGTNVGVIEQNGAYYYDVFGNFVDLSNYVQKNQVATENAIGLVGVGYSANGQNYPLKVDENGNAYTNVPWTNNDPNAVHFTSQTLTDEQKLQARKNISAAAEEQALKNMYNLGAYDTFTDNGDGTATITRKTYTVLDYASLDWYFGATTGEGGDAFYCDFKGVFDDSNLTNFIISNTSKINIGNGNANYTTRITNGGGLQIVLPTSLTNGSADVLRNYLNEGGNIIAQIPLATSYTEEVILDQPIHTLDVNGEQFVRDEWEKGLNLFNIDEANLSVTNDCSATKDDNGNITIVKTGSDPYINDLFHFYATSAKYTVSARSSKDMQIFVNINGTYSSSQNIPTPVFTFSCNIGDSIYLRLDGNDESSGSSQTFSEIMLVEGDHAYPYQPYNGKIVHEKELENYLPLSGGTIDGNLNVTEQLQENGVRVYSPNNKPSASDVGALPNTGGTVNGNTTVNGTFTVANHNMTVGGKIVATGDLDVNNANVSGNAYADNVYVKQNGESVAVYSPINPPPGASISVTENSDGTVNLVI